MAAARFTAPFVVPGYEPGPDGEAKTAEERAEIVSTLKQMRLVQSGMESPVAKAALSGVMGFGLGAFFSLMSSSFALEDPFRAPQYDGMTTMAKSKLVFKEMGRGMLKTGSGFGKVGALYAGSECVIEGYRAKNDWWNSIYAGGVSGAVLARQSGLKAMLFGAAGFAAFSAAIDTYIRWDSPDEDA